MHSRECSGDRAIPHRGPGPVGTRRMAGWNGTDLIPILRGGSQESDSMNDTGKAVNPVIRPPGTGSRARKPSVPAAPDRRVPYHGKLARALASLNRVLAGHLACAANRKKVVGHATRADRCSVLGQCLRDLHAAGYHIEDVRHLLRHPPPGRPRRPRPASRLRQRPVRGTRRPTQSGARGRRKPGPDHGSRGPVASVGRAGARARADHHGVLWNCRTAWVRSNRPGSPIGRGDRR